MHGQPHIRFTKRMIQDKELGWAIRPTMQIDNWLTAASYQETASCRYTARWYAQRLPMVQNGGHSP